MIINKISQTNDIYINTKYVEDFGVSFNLSYRFVSSGKTEKNLRIFYKINLVENRNKLIGVICAEYEFILAIETDNAVTISEERIVKDCLKKNHYNIRDLIEETLELNQINIKKDYASFMN